jgi:peptidoglycan/LPS O-acetylase OafA/YrhL
MNPRRELLPALTPLRFPAAFAAVLFHVWGMFLGPNGRTPPISIWHLWSGVSFFFVLSGFILTYNYLDEFRNPTRRGVWNFLVARWARTYPVHILTFLLIFPLEYRRLVGGAFGNPYISVATHLGMGFAFLPMTMAKAHSFNTPSWSLSAEWFFYLLLPPIILALTRGSLVRRAAIVLALLTPWALAVAGMFGSTLLGPITPYRYPPIRLADFLAGVLLAMAWHSRHGAGVPTTVSVRRATVVELAAVLFAAAWAWVLVVKIKNVNWLMATGWIGVYVPPFLVLIWVLARGGGLVSRALASRVPTYLGDISFAFYMIHQPLLNYIHFEGHRIGVSGWPWVWKWVAAMGGSLVLAAACYQLYEIPLRDWLRRRLSIRKPKGEVPVTTPALPDASPADAPARRAA